MKKILYILTGLITLVCCAQQDKTDIENAHSELRTKNQSFSDFDFRIENLNQEDFEIVERNDTILIFRKSYEGIDGAIIQFDPKSISEISAKIKYDFGFVQYTIDDNPVFPLDFTKESKWADLKNRDGIIEIPDFYGNTENSSAFEVLGFEDSDELIKWIELEDFESIKSESINIQTEFYRELMEKKSQYESCCPEYIEQANDFLQTQSFKSINQLGLELIYKEVAIILEGKLLDGSRFRKVIIEEKK